MESPKISIIIPSFNKVKFISETLKSIVNQNYPNMEIIIQDGGSSDGSLEIIKKYASTYPKVIKYKFGKDKGQLEAINEGLKKSSGEILAFINADDIYDPGAFTAVAEAYNIYPDALWFAGSAKVIDHEGKEIAKFTTFYKNILLSCNYRIFLLVTNYLMQPSVFIKRATYQRYGPFTGTRDFVTEYDLWLRLSVLAMPVVIKSLISKFRIEPGTITKQKTVKLLEQDEKMVRKYTKNPFVLALHKLHNIARELIVENI